MSGLPRKVKPAGVELIGWTPCSQYGEYSNWLTPPPPEYHAASPW